jgi:hypothetical protein
LPWMTASGVRSSWATSARRLRRWASSLRGGSSWR